MRKLNNLKSHLDQITAKFNTKKHTLQKFYKIKAKAKNNNNSYDTI